MVGLHSQEMTCLQFTPSSFPILSVVSILSALIRWTIITTPLLLWFSLWFKINLAATTVLHLSPSTIEPLALANVLTVATAKELIKNMFGPIIRFAVASVLLSFHARRISISMKKLVIANASLLVVFLDILKIWRHVFAQNDEEEATAQSVEHRTDPWLFIQPRFMLIARVVPFSSLLLIIHFSLVLMVELQMEEMIGIEFTDSHLLFNAVSIH
jgi:hypothetical protein